MLSRFVALSVSLARKASRLQLWELRRRLGKNRTIICNFTGKIYDCNGQQPCFCDAGNEVRPSSLLSLLHVAQ